MLVWCDESKCVSDLTRPRRATYTVDVIVRRLRHIEVDHVAKRFDIDSSRRNVGCDKNLVVAVLETRQRCGALRLRAVSMNSLRLDSFFHQLLGQTVRAVLGACKNQCLRHFTALEQGQE